MEQWFFSKTGKVVVQVITKVAQFYPTQQNKQKIWTNVQLPTNFKPTSARNQVAKHACGLNEKNIQVHLYTFPLVKLFVGI